MLIAIPDILTQIECTAIREAISDDALWRDGKATAAGMARDAKNNEQADSNAPAVRGALKKIETALLDNRIFNSATQVDRIGRMVLSRYRDGMAYGEHVDAPYINNLRTDISMTVFLSDLSEYDGGALVVKAAGHDDAIRLAAGSVVLYPSSSLHEVLPVTKGERIACVGWIKSKIKSSDRRKIVFDLESAIATLRSSGADKTLINRFANVRNNLLRTFGD